MTTSGITIDPAAIQGFVEKAILDGITPAQRDDIIAQAVANLLVKKETSSYGVRNKTTSLLEDAFAAAVNTAAYTVVRERFENDPEVKARITAIVSPVIAEIAHGNYDGLPEIIGSAIGSAVADWLRNRT